MKLKIPRQSELIKLQRNAASVTTTLTGTGTQRRLLIYDGARHQNADHVFRLASAGAALELLIVVFGRARDNFRINLEVQHLAPRTRSNIALCAVLFENSSVDFRGKVAVPGVAQQSETFLRCDSVLLSPQAHSITIPSLEIIADDVKAGHAASIGHLDDDKLFYFQTRGFSPDKASMLLLQSLIHDSLKVFSGD